MRKILTIASVFVLTACSLNEKSNFVFSISNSNNNIIVTTRANDTKTNKKELEIEELLPMRESTFSIIITHADVLDDETTPYTYGTNYSSDGTPDSINFFKYTFYIKNTSNVETTLYLQFYVTDIKTNNSQRSFIDTLRMMIFENESKDSHSYNVYAKQAAEYNFDKEGNKTLREFISTYPEDHSNKEDDEHPLVADSFKRDENESSNYYIDFSRESFKPNQQIRYTFVVWLEGEDPQSDNSIRVPEGAFLKYGVKISQ